MTTLTRALPDELASLKETPGAAEARNDALLNSTSWKLTAPLRKAVDTLAARR